MKRIAFFVTIVFYSLALSAQTEKQADQLFSNKQYNEALSAYTHLLERSPKNTLYLYRLARCLEETGDAEEAIRYFEMAGNRYPLKHLHLGMLLQQTYRFTQAIDEYNAYIATLKENDSMVDSLAVRIEYCRKGERYLRRVHDISIIDCLTVKKESVLSAYLLSAESGTLSRDNNKFGYTNQRRDRSFLTVEDQNGHLCLAIAQRLLNQWSELDTLSTPIRSKANENSPYVLADGITIYFASDRPQGLGGLDIYMSQRNIDNDTWYEPENLGFPFNSEKNDYLFAIDEAKQIGYFATDRASAEGYVTIYRFVPNQQTRIFRGTEEQTRERAMLKSWSVAQLRTTETTEPEQEEDIETEDIKKTATPLFIVNDDNRYFSESEFHSDEARQMFHQLSLLNKELQSESGRLDQLREEYAAATAERKMQLENLILVNEQTLRNLTQEKRQLEKQIRVKELE